MEISSEAAASREMNCCSVALKAASGMLLMSPMVSSWPACAGNCRVPLRRGPGAIFPLVRLESTNTGIGVSFLQSSAFARWLFNGRRGRGESVIEILKDVVNVLDPDAETNHLRKHACAALFLRGHLAMRSRGGMTDQRFCVA